MKKTIIIFMCAGNLLFIFSCNQNQIKEKKEAGINITTTTGSTTSPTNAGSTTGSKEGMNDMMGIMEKNMDEVNQIKLTGDPDYDYATIISAHNKGGIDMADMEIKNGENKELINLARKIKSQQEKEIKELKKYTSPKNPVSSTKNCKEEMNQCKEKCYGEMKKMSMSGSVDQDFAKMMSMHHQHGIEMSRIEDKCGNNEKVKGIAQKSIRDQEQEMMALEAYSKSK